MYDVVKRIKRIKDKKNDVVVFRDEFGKICFLDSSETQRTFKVGDTTLASVLSNKETNDYVRTSIDGILLVYAIDNIPFVKINELTKGYLAFIRSIINYDIGFNKVYISLLNKYGGNRGGIPNLQDEYNNGDARVRDIVTALDYLYYKFNSGSNDVPVQTIEVVESKLREMRAMESASENFDSQLAKNIYTTNKLLSSLTENTITRYNTLKLAIESDGDYIINVNSKYRGVITINGEDVVISESELHTANGTLYVNGIDTTEFTNSDKEKILKSILNVQLFKNVWINNEMVPQQKVDVSKLINKFSM